jgi:hypothetical protein
LDVCASTPEESTLVPAPKEPKVPGFQNAQPVDMDGAAEAEDNSTASRIEKAEAEDNAAALACSTSVLLDESLVALADGIYTPLTDSGSTCTGAHESMVAASDDNSTAPTSNESIGMDESEPASTDPATSSPLRDTPPTNSGSTGAHESTVAASDDNSTVPTSNGSIGMDEIVPASTVPAMASPLRDTSPIDSGSTGAHESMVAASDDNSTAPTSNVSIGMDEIVPASTIPALVSPLRDVSKPSGRPRNFLRGQTVAVRGQVETTGIPQEPQPVDGGTSGMEVDESVLAARVPAMVSPLAGRCARKVNARRRNLFRGQTVGAKGQIDTTGIPEDKLQDLTSTFTQYDEDGNGRLSVLEFGKFLQDVLLTLFRQRLQDSRCPVIDTEFRR